MYNKKKTYEHQRNGMDFAGWLREITIQVSGFHLSTIFIFNHHETWQCQLPPEQAIDAELCIEK